VTRCRHRHRLRFECLLLGFDRARHVISATSSQQRLPSGRAPYGGVLRHNACVHGGKEKEKPHTAAYYVTTPTSTAEKKRKKERNKSGPRGVMPYGPIEWVFRKRKPYRQAPTSAGAGKGAAGSHARGRRTEAIDPIRADLVRFLLPPSLPPWMARRKLRGGAGTSVCREVENEVSSSVGGGMRDRLEAFFFPLRLSNPR
jgi:hypothetical protein